MSQLAEAAPFLFNNWPLVLLGTVTVALATALLYVLTPSSQNPDGSSIKEERNRSPPGDIKEGTAKSKPKTITSFDKGEHPLAEFDDEKPDASLLAPPLHSADTPHIPYKPDRLTNEEMIMRSKDFYEAMNKRRSVREFSKEPVPIEVIENIVKTAGTSPSGAHSEPWTFVVIQDPKIKSQIRDIVEEEEYHNYDRRMGDKWVNDLKFVGTTHEKPYLEDAPYIIIVMKQQYHIGEDGVKYAHYYYEISTAIAAGMLVAAIHKAGLVTVTTTPLNAGGALRELLGRPENEKVMLLLPVGLPAEDAKVPDVSRKPLDKIMVLK